MKRFLSLSLALTLLLTGCHAPQQPESPEPLPGHKSSDNVKRFFKLFCRYSHSCGQPRGNTVFRYRF